MKIKSTGIFYFTPVRLAMIKKTNKCWEGCRWAKGTPYSGGGNIN
jgi:hypothetical protein